MCVRACYLHTERLGVVGPVGAAREVGQVELDLVPALVEPHGHGADEGLHPRRALVVTGTETPPHVFIIQHLNGRTLKEKLGRSRHKWLKYLLKRDPIYPLAQGFELKCVAITSR